MKLLHDRETPNTKDTYFVTGGNPAADSGGGVIGTRNTIGGAQALQKEVVKEGYRGVRILTWDELMAEPEK